MNRTESIGLGLFITIAVATDGWFLACLLSLPMMEAALVYGDSIGKDKGYPSAGYRCLPAGGAG